MGERYIVKTGPLGAVCVAEIGNVRFMEARISIAGRVIPWGESVFEEA